MDVSEKCANCGKEGNNLNTCNKCKEAKYCNAACKKKRRKTHKKACEKRVAELHDEKLFKDPPLPDECPICMIVLPYMDSGRRYENCCGKTICSGCIHEVAKLTEDQTCAFCRAPAAFSNEVLIRRLMKRIEVNDAEATHHLGCFYYVGSHGLQRNYAKALDLSHRASELGFAAASYNIGHAHMVGNGVEVDQKKGIHYYELAAIGGDLGARRNLGNAELRAARSIEGAERAIKLERAIKHYMIVVRNGDSGSLDMIRVMGMQQKKYLRTH